MLLEVLVVRNYILDLDPSLPGFARCVTPTAELLSLAILHCWEHLINKLHATLLRWSELRIVFRLRFKSVICCILQQLWKRLMRHQGSRGHRFTAILIPARFQSNTSCLDIRSLWGPIRHLIFRIGSRVWGNRVLWLVVERLRKSIFICLQRHLILRLLICENELLSFGILLVPINDPLIPFQELLLNSLSWYFRESWNKIMLFVERQVLPAYHSFTILV